MLYSKASAKTVSNQNLSLLKMPPPPLILLLVTLLVPISTPSAARAPPSPLLRHENHFTKNNYQTRNISTTSASSQQYFELTRPLLLDGLIPACRKPVLPFVFGHTVGLPPTTVEYSPPANCTWSNVSLHLSFGSKGNQKDRIAAIWLDGVELIRTSTAQPTDDGVFWNVRKDITRYSSLLRQENLTLFVMLENVVNDVYTASYALNLTFLYYDTASNKTGNRGSNFPLSLIPPYQKPDVIKLKENPVISTLNQEESSLNIYEKPADLIIPVAGSGDEGFWFRIDSGSDIRNVGIQMPSNTYRAVIEVYVSFHGNDEFWYTNPPDTYIEINNLNTEKGNGAYREVLVTLDDKIVGSVIPFPVIYAGGINPYSWQPIVSIGAFDLPSYDFDLTPFLGNLLDGKVHSFGLQVADAISYWFVDANLHLWLDNNVTQVQAMAIKYTEPTIKLEREDEFSRLDGSLEVEGKRKAEFSGWVNSSRGNFTTLVYQKIKFENSIEFSGNGTKKVVEQKVKVKSEVRIKSSSGDTVSYTTVKREYPLKITTNTFIGIEDNTYLIKTKIKNSLEERKSSKKFSSSLENSQKSKGWMFVMDQNILSGGATTHQSYTYKDNTGSYSKEVSATNGQLEDETRSFLGSSSLSM